MKLIINIVGWILFGFFVIGWLGLEYSFSTRYFLIKLIVLLAILILVVIFKKSSGVWLFGCFFLFLVINYSWEFSAPNVEQLTKPVHQEIRTHWNEFGKPPQELRALNIKLPKSRYGKYSYEAQSNSYHLRLGTYGVDRIEATWTCTKSECDLYIDS